MSRSLVTRSRLVIAASALAVTGALGGTALAAADDGTADNVADPSRAAVSAPTADALPIDAHRFAVIDSGGAVVRSSAGVTSGLTAAQNVEVLFDRDIRGCAYTASIGGRANDVPPPGFITVSQRAGKANGVFVAMRNPDQSKAVLPFHLTVTC
ncbi:hypothetical protein CcI49_37715 [Frankia sp. CcI49]|uniref:hypothetical protein n=1 Tax=Frankia sp. CcI49 TaxID=1745382 RepID=UPI0009768613|nr:hypothetical protein [Frankia sp. CcI49]ONH50040.1 hypothetical protein CcI49_37715 [Frankia sp. CcI49]